MNAPLDPEDLVETVARLEDGADYKTELERLMFELPPEHASRLDLVLRESRGAWCPLAGDGHASALFVGNALSGTALALARRGLRVTLVDVRTERLRFALARDRGLGDGRATAVYARADRLPFAAQSFDLVVLERSVAPVEGELDAVLASASRVARSELVLVDDNRFGYKRSTGHRGAFRFAGAREWLGEARSDRRTLGGYRRALEALGRPPHAAYALYPDGRDYSLVANLARGAGPELYVGPKERKNLPKLAAYRLGLFRSFTSTFALFSRREPRANGTVIDRVLDECTARTGEPRPRLHHWIATRGNSAVVLTESADGSERGRWVIHMPFSPKQEIRVLRNFRRLGEIAEQFPSLPSAAPLCRGTVDGLTFTCQRRLPGLSAAQISGETERVRRLHESLGPRLAELVVAEPAALEGTLFDELVEAKFELVLHYTRAASTRRELEAMRERARELLRGQSVPRVLYHADLRSKHVQVRPDGALVAFLDWGSSESCDLPYFDLVNFMVHERQHETGGSGRAAWDFVRERSGLRPWERRTLDEYADRLGLSDDYRRGIEAIFPVLVGAMAEKNWDFSRPRWLQRLYGVG